jgi:hypothetical protein
VSRRNEVTSKNWKYITWTFLTILGNNVFAQTVKLAVINTSGQVWARDLDLVGNTVGQGVRLSGPGLFGGPDDQFVVASTNSISVITTSGAVWPRSVDNTTIGPGVSLFGSLFGGPNSKYVLSTGCGIYVINNGGQVWSHFIAGTSVGAGSQLKGPGLFGGPNDKYAVFDQSNSRILIINTLGQVWAHDLTSSVPQSFCPDSVGDGYQLTGPGLFGGPNDAYVVSVDSHLLVINTLGQVWARDLTRTTVGAGHKLGGPGLFGRPNDKYVVVYSVVPQPPPPK